MAFDVKVQKPAAEPEELVVILHGLKRVILQHVPRVISNHLPNADILQPTYDAGWPSNLDPIQLAAELSELIQAQCDAHASTAGSPYKRIILIGHSRGALLIRKAYVFACGQNQELWRGGLRPQSQPWARAVTRIILMAGMNRGWSLSPKPPRMSWPRCLTLRCAERATVPLRVGRLMRSLKRGSPFVANLRVQWINLVRSGHPMPRTVQILGDMDDLVTSRDNIDLQAGRNFVYLNAPRGTTHTTVVDLRNPAREQMFLRALLTPDNDLRSEYVLPDAQSPDERVEQVVFIVHGIRDFGGWTRRLASVMMEQAKTRGRRIVTVTSSYGYFPMLKFLIFSARQKNVRWFMDEYTEALAKYPNARPIDFAGHSNGTYLLASALKRYQTCTFRRAVLAGTVLPRNFEWDQMVADGRIEAIRNYVATSDWVVGIFPRMFERFGDIGAAGLLGFLREPAARNEFHYISGGHGAAVSTENLQSMAAFLLDGDPAPAPRSITREKQASVVLVTSKLYWMVWLLLLFGLTVAAWWVAFVWSPELVPYAWMRVLLFVGLLIAVLNSI